ncbi:GNAT family N-acetyltransferase [Streptomyces decoyicus]|uniref:GNAT family N-acetyltransferase n=1 Tax=Streptomyces decoyicus TaxID=249567 RepID=UPI0033E0E356
MAVVPALPNKQAFRPITGSDEVELFNQIPYVLNHEVAGDLISGRRRRDGIWIALDDEGQLLARVAWWCRPSDTSPLLLDVFDYLPGHESTGAALLRSALTAVVPRGTTPPKYTRFLPPDWRDDPAVRTAVDGRLAVVEQLGARLFVERLRLEWVPESPVPEPSGRLAFRPVSGESPDSGEPVGLVIAARNQYRPIIAYLGVLAEHRGRGYIDEILAEGTRVLATAEPELSGRPRTWATLPWRRPSHMPGTPSSSVRSS